MSDAVGWQRVKGVFQAALDRPPEARAAFLDTACGDDLDLRREVESLLGAEQRAGAFLSRPAAAAAEPEVAGRRIGPYRVLGRIGEGGMGVVYRAVRDDDVFRKTVALKVAHASADPEHLRRLGRERQILARLQHPNIATIFDGGTTEEGRPYLVMEHVEGQPIDVHCDARGLGARERLQMFRAVCGAVHYAHQNLVVHRDLKAQNILVTSDGQPKLLDFGIAKLLAAGVDPDEAPTATLLPMMTPEYASPEQVRGQPVTTASDVYSLGVVLYELLTGSRPYTVRTDSLEGIVRTVCETAPAPPSVAAQERGRETARTSATRPSAAELRGDVDTIVLKALRKEPERRYLSALEMSEDIRRHLEGQTVLARPDTMRYRLSKFVGRHRAAAAGAALVLASLVGGMVTTIREARIAEANRSRAERRFNDVRRLASSLLFDIHDEIRELPGATRARQRIVATAQEYLDGLAREAQGDVALQRELAAAYERLADVEGGVMSGNVGDSRSALDTYRRALAIRESVAAAKGAPPADATALAHVQLRLADVLQSMNRLPEAEQSYRAATARLEGLAASGARDDFRSELASAYQALASVQVGLGRPEEAGPALQKAIANAEGFCHDHPDDLRAQAILAGAYHADSERSRARGQHREALARARQARAMQEGLVQRDPLNQRHVRALLFSLNREAVDLWAVGQRPVALATYRHAVEVAEEMLRRDPKDRWAQAAVMVADSALGGALVAAGEARHAQTVLGQGREIAARIVAEDPALGFARNELAVIDANLGRALRMTGKASDLSQACQAFRRSLEGWRQLRAQGPLTADSVEAMRQVEAELARCPGASK